MYQSGTSYLLVVALFNQWLSFDIQIDIHGCTSIHHCLLYKVIHDDKNAEEEEKK